MVNNYSGIFSSTMYLPNLVKGIINVLNITENTFEIELIYDGCYDNGRQRHLTLTKNCSDGSTFSCNDAGQLITFIFNLSNNISGIYQTLNPTDSGTFHF